MGQPNGVHTPLSNTESIGIGREPPELKHLSRARKRDIKRDSVSSGERTRKRANREEKSFRGTDCFKD